MIKLSGEYCTCKMPAVLRKERKTMIALIVAYAENRVIGNKGCIPWKIKGEQKRFKELTTGNVVVRNCLIKKL